MERAKIEAGRGGRWLAVLSAALLAVLAPGVARAAEAGDVTGTFMLGTNVWTHHFPQDGKAAFDTTIADAFALSQFVGAGVFVTDRLRLGLNLQFTEAVTEPAKPYPSRFTIFGLLPQVNYNFWGPFTASVVPTILLRSDGVNQTSWGVQGVFTYAIGLGRGLSAVLGVEVPYFFSPHQTIGVTPLAGVSCKL